MVNISNNSKDKSTAKQSLKIGVFISLFVGSMTISQLVLADLASASKAYFNGDYQVAFAEYKLLAEQGDADAQASLGVLYTKGQGVQKDYKQAFLWYRRAAEQGNPSYQVKLGNMYKRGRGITPDPVLAYAWLQLAALQSHSRGEGYRDRLAEKLTPKQIEEALKLSEDISEKIEQSK